MIIYGMNAVKEALKKELVINLYIIDPDEKIDLSKVNYQLVDKKYISKLTKTENHQNIAAEIKANFLKDMNFLNKAISENEVDKILVLDHIEDQHNLGAIIRSAEVFGYKHIIMSKERSAQITSTTIKTSVGAIFNVNIIQTNNLVNILKDLKNNNFWIVGGLLDDKAIGIDKVRYDFNVCLVIGNENSGISHTLIKQLDYKVIIPMQGQTQSLNASVSAAIMMYQTTLNNI